LKKSKLSHTDEITADSSAAVESEKVNALDAGALQSGNEIEEDLTSSNTRRIMETMEDIQSESSSDEGPSMRIF
jgi:hypothetical protein